MSRQAERELLEPPRLHRIHSAVKPAWYCSSLTFSIQSTVLPSSCSTMAMCVIAVVAVAPCQCFSRGGHETTSPGRIFSIGPPQLWTKPQPAVTISDWPSGWMCHAVRAPGSNVTLTPSARAGLLVWKRGSIRTLPVKFAAGPLTEACEPLLLMSIFLSPKAFEAVRELSDKERQWFGVSSNPQRSAIHRIEAGVAD